MRGAQGIVWRKQETVRARDRGFHIGESIGFSDTWGKLADLHMKSRHSARNMACADELLDILKAWKQLHSFPTLKIGSSLVRSS